MNWCETEFEHIHPLTVLKDLSSYRQRPVLFLCGTSLFASDTATALYAFLRQLGHQQALDVVFQSNGGDPIAARRLAVLLREFTEHLTILVLQQAHSAGALFCLAADELVMSPLGTLSPIDPQLPGQLAGRDDRTGMFGQEKGLPPPDSIATEEMRCFRAMASAWFGVGETIEERLALLHTFTSRLYPTTLTALFRADMETRQAASELLSYHQSDVNTHHQISEQLVGGFFNHAHAIHRQEARQIGLNVAYTTPAEEACLWRLLNWWLAYKGCIHTDPARPGQTFRIGSVLIGKDFAAQDERMLPARVGEEESSPVPSGTRALPRYAGFQAGGGWRRVSPDTLSLDYHATLATTKKEEQDVP